VEVKSRLQLVNYLLRIEIRVSDTLGGDKKVEKYFSGNLKETKRD